MTTQTTDTFEVAEQELEAHTKIIRALKPLSAESREKVIQAVALIIGADQLIPGTLKAFRERKENTE